MAALTIAKHLFKRKRAATTTTVPAGSKHTHSSSPMSSPSLITATSFATTSDSRSESSRSRRRTPVVVASMMMMAIPASSALGSRTTLASSIAQPSATTTVAVTTPTTTTVTATTTVTDATLSCIEGFQDEPILPGTSIATTDMSSTTTPATRTGSFLRPRRATAKHSSTRPLSSYDCNRPLPPLPPQTATEGATCCMEVEAETETEATSPRASAPQRSNTTPVKPLAFFSLPIRLGGARSRPRSGVCATTENARFWQQQPPKKADKQPRLHPMAHAASSPSLSTHQSTLPPLPLHKVASSPSPLRRGYTLPAEERSKECLGQPCMHMHSQPITNVQPKQTILPITRLKRQPTKLFRRFSAKFGGSTETLPTSETVAQEYARTIKALWQMVEEEELSQRIADATPEEREWIIRQYSSTPVANHPFLRQYQNESNSSLGLGITNSPIQAISNTNSSSSSSNSTMFPFHENASWTTDGESTATAPPNQINHILKTRLHSPQYLSPLHRVSPQDHERQQDSNTCQSRLFGEDETDDEQGPTPDQLQRRRKSQLVYGQADYEAQMSNVSLPDAYGVTVSTPVLTTLVSSATVGKRGRSATQVSSRVWQFAQELQKRDRFTIEDRMHLEDEWRLQGRFQRAGPGCRPASMVLLQRRATQVEDGTESVREDRWIEALKSGGGGPWPNNESCATFVGSENGTEDDERGETAVIKVARKVSVRQSLRVPAHHVPVLLSQP